MSVIVFYRVPVPYSMDDSVIEVYGEADMGWYEWRVVEGGRVKRDTKSQGYGSAEICLRDALVEMSGDI